MLPRVRFLWYEPAEPGQGPSPSQPQPAPIGPPPPSQTPPPPPPVPAPIVVPGPPPPSQTPAPPPVSYVPFTSPDAALQAQLEAAIAAINGVSQNLEGNVTNAINSAWAALAEGAAGFDDDLQFLIDEATDAVSSVESNLQNTLGDWIDAAQDDLQAVGDAIAAEADQFIQEASEAIGEAGSALGAVGSGIVALATAFDDLPGHLLDAVNEKLFGGLASAWRRQP